MVWISGGAAQPRFAVAPEATPEFVFRWSTQRCEAWHLPDSPARALRRQDGGIALIAAHLVTIPLLGPDFDSLAPACGAASRGAERDDPAAFQDRVWVQALIPFVDAEGARVLGLASHEYMGGRHPGRCVTTGAFRCWYSAITALVAREADWRFRHAGVVAAPPTAFDPARVARNGFFSVSNALIEDGQVRVMVYTEGIDGQPRGNCLLRAPRAALPGGWRADAGDGQESEFPGAYAHNATPMRPCAVVGDTVFAGAPVRTLLRLDGADGRWWVAGFTRGPIGQEGAGVFISLSRDLLRWAPAVRLFAMAPFRGQSEAGVYSEYPSLIDHASDSAVFDTISAAPRLHLYLTRFNLEDRRRGLDRDLVRIAVQVKAD